MISDLKCYNCGSRWVVTTRKSNIRYCRKCGAEWKIGGINAFKGGERVRKNNKKTEDKPNANTGSIS